MVLAQRVSTTRSERSQAARFVVGFSLAILIVASSESALLAQGCDPVQTGGALGWAIKAPMPESRVGASAVMIGNRIYVTHGIGPGGPTATTLIYDRGTNTWTTGASASVARQAEGVCIEGPAGQGQLFVVGGATVEIYDPGTNAWSTGASMPTNRGVMGVAYMPGFGVLGGGRGTVYVIGGSSGGPTGVNEAYDVELNQWLTVAPMPVPLFGLSSTIFSPDTGLIYVFGGTTGSVLSAAVQIYDPQADAWATGAPMPTARSHSISGICGGMIFVIGGNTTGNVATTVNEVYSPFTDSWLPSTPKPTATGVMASEYVSSGLDIYAIGGVATGVFSAANELFTCGAVALCPPSLNCSDGDACTADYCDGATGECRHYPSAPPEVDDSLRLAHDRTTGITTLTWAANSCSTIFNSYRGTIPTGYLGSRGAVPYDQVCLESADTAGNGATVSTTTLVPPVGTASYFQVSGESFSGEGSLGNRTGGTQIPNNSPCPTPPPL